MPRRRNLWVTDGSNGAWKLRRRRRRVNATPLGGRSKALPRDDASVRPASLSVFTKVKVTVRGIQAVSYHSAVRSSRSHRPALDPFSIADAIQAAPSEP